MADITTEQLKEEISEILKDADLTSLSSKSVRQQLQTKFNCNLTARKEEIDDLLMELVDSEESKKSKEEESAKSSEEESEKEEKKATKRTSASARKAPPKKIVKKASDEESASEDNESEEEYSPKKNAPKPKKRGGRRKKGSDSDSDDWKKPKKTKKTGAKGKATGFTRAYTLSPELASLMGAESLPRHEVVKKMWAMIKERNLYDPKNKQYVICDEDLLKVIGTKRFRSFAMLKYLKSHFIN